MHRVVPLFALLLLLTACLAPSPPSQTIGGGPASSARASVAPTADASQPLPACDRRAAPPLSVIHFFDWYPSPDNGPINGPKWTHQIDWASYGLSPEQVGGSKAYYDSQFALIERLGVDGIVYQYYKEADGSIGTKLSATFLDSLSRHQTKIGLFYDWEIQMVGAIGPVLSQQGYIKPTAAQAATLIDDIAGFYERVPRSHWLLDRNGRLPIMVFAFGFDQSNTDAAAWHGFYQSVLSGLERRLGVAPVFYWTARNLIQLEYAFQHFPQQFRPFNFVLDMPQPQLAPGAVTWNINFDNLGVWRFHKLQRVVRDDPRYLQEMIWLAKHTAPELLFIYSWNEYYEGANIMPDRTYGTSRYAFMQALLKDLRENSAPRLPCTLLVVDDYAQLWQTDDWHLKLGEQFTLYPLRRLAPQADVRLASAVTPELLEQYDLIIMLAQTSPAAIEQLAPLLDRKRVVVIGPRAAYVDAVRQRFASRVERVVRNKEVALLDADGASQGMLMARDDVFDLTPAPDVRIAARIIDGAATPVLLRHGDDWWMNSYAPDDRLLAPIFAQVYGRPLEPGIMYGEGVRSQRLEVAPDGTVTQNTFEAPAVFEHEPLPAPWSPPPPALPTPTP